MSPLATSQNLKVDRNSTHFKLGRIKLKLTCKPPRRRLALKVFKGIMLALIIFKGTMQASKEEKQLKVLSIFNTDESQ